MTIKKYAVPAGVTSITLPNGSVLIPSSGVVETDSQYESELVRSGCVSDGALYLLGVPRVLWQTGIPFVMPGGDGGANGLNFTGTRGVFTLSAAILAGVSAMLGGCYLYLPAGAGGLGSAGWRWAEFTDDTNGEVFQETYVPGSGLPTWLSSPTQQPNLTAGRITQTTSEITCASFLMPGGSMGNSGLFEMFFKQVANNSAGSKICYQKWNGTNINLFSITTAYNDFDYIVWKQNAGSASKQIGNRQGAILLNQTTYSGDHNSLDTSADITITVTIKLSANVDSMVMIPRLATVRYGA